jgi:hypothetical protein
MLALLLLPTSHVQEDEIVSAVGKEMETLVTALQDGEVLPHLSSDIRCPLSRFVFCSRLFWCPHVADEAQPVAGD